MDIRRAFFSGVSAAGLLAAPKAFAQSADPGADGNGAAQVEEIVVTAQRRSENMQRVPIAIEQVSGTSAANQGVTNSNALSMAVPGLQLSQGSNATVPFLRGIGTTASAAGNEASVAMYVDDVYISSVIGALFEFNNISAIEVLKGPQGTLFGRNATGGVIHVRTKDPSFKPTAAVSVGYANYNTVSGAFYGSTGLSDTLAANIALYGRNQADGWGVNLTTGQETFKTRDYGARVKLLWTPSDSTRVLLAADYNNTRNMNGVGFHVVKGSFGVGGTTYGGFFNTYDDPSDITRVRQTGVSAKIEQSLGGLKLVSITSHRATRGYLKLDQDTTPIRIVDADIYQQDRTTTQEIQLLSPSDSKLKWIVGLYLYRDTSKYNPVRLAGLAAGSFDYIDFNTIQVSSSVAAFAQFTYPITGATELTGGIRYTRDKRRIEGETIAQLGATPISLESGRQNARWAQWTWRLALSHQFNDDIMAYASYNRGFKSGIYSLLTYSSAPVDPEVLDAYEVGLKTEFLNRKVRLNASAFYYDYTNIQVQQIVSGTSVYLNASSAKIKGAEVSVTARPMQALSLKAGGAWLHGRYGTFLNAPFNVPNGFAAGGGNQVVTGDATGFPTVRSPDFTGNVSADYVVPLGSGDLTLAGSYYFNSGFNWDPDGRLKQDAYSLVNASADWSPEGNEYNVRLWVKNLTNKNYCIYSTATPLSDACSPAAPRTYGITLSVHH